jgi:biopolymer transport protein TolQ
VYQEGYIELQRIREKFQNRPNSSEKLNEYMQNQGMEALLRSIQNGQIKVAENLQDNLSTLASIGSITPFVGLFGTVWGIIDSFKGLSQGGGSLEAVAPGIAEALVATAIGLAAAIPAVWFFNFYQAKLNKVQREMDQFEKDLINNIQRAITVA